MTGGFAAACNFLSRMVFNKWFSFSTSIVLAYVIGMITAFILNKTLVFKESTQDLHTSILFFLLINLFAIFQTWMVTMGLNSFLFPYLGIVNYPMEIAHGIGILFPVFLSYFGHKSFSFKSR
jgi:putative flippase GtrA